MLVDHEIQTPRSCQECNHYLGGCKCCAFDQIPIDIYTDAESHNARRSDQKGDYVFASDKPAETTRIYESKD